MLNTRKLEKSIYELKKRVETLEWLSEHKPIFKDGSTVGNLKIVSSRLMLRSSISHRVHFFYTQDNRVITERHFVYTCYDEKHNVVVEMYESELIEIEEQNKKKHE